MRKLFTISLIMGALMIGLGCSVSGISIDTVKVGELTRDTDVVELNDADEVRVDIKIDAGELHIDGEADALLEAEFTYNVTDWKPEVRYQVEEGQGRLSIQQPKTDKISLSGDIRYEWDLQFNAEVPLDMRINGGAGTSDVRLGNLNITRVDFQLGVGDADIDLSGNTSLTEMNVDMGMGMVTIDLTGNWEHDVAVDIQGGVGRTLLILPEDVGVRVKVDKGLGDVDASGLYHRDGTYVNSAYDEADIVLKINVQAGVGQIDLRIED